MNRNLLVIGLGVLLFAGACKKADDLCEEERTTAAFLFDYPDSVLVDTFFNLNVSYVVENSCGEFGSFDGKLEDKTLEVKLRTQYVGCSCNPEFVEQTAAYPIAFDDTGTYTLKFWVAENEYDNYMIEVYQ